MRKVLLGIMLIVASASVSAECDISGVKYTKEWQPKVFVADAYCDGVYRTVVYDGLSGTKWNYVFNEGYVVAISLDRVIYRNSVDDSFSVVTKRGAMGGLAKERVAEFLGIGDPLPIDSIDFASGPSVNSSIAVLQYRQYHSATQSTTHRLMWNFRRDTLIRF